MKTMKTNMWGLILFLGFFEISGYCNSEDTNSERQEEKEVRKVQMEINLDSIVHSGRYVFIANSQTGDSFTRQIIDPVLHFIKLDGPNGIMQIGFDQDKTAGAGMSTLKGSITNYKVSSDKKFNYKITFDFRTGGGLFKLFLMVSEDNNVTARIDNHLTMYGHLVALDEANIIELQN
jgi:hypothetical protein